MAINKDNGIFAGTYHCAVNQWVFVVLNSGDPEINTPRGSMLLEVLLSLNDAPDAQGTELPGNDHAKDEYSDGNP